MARSDQRQDAGEGDAYQAGRDISVSYHGLQLQDVKDICLMLLENNFPKLREEAMLESKKAVESFGDKLLERLSEEAELILESRIEEKLSSAEIQSSINNSVMACAKRGRNSSPEALSEMIVAKVHATDDSDEEESLVFTEAINAVEKLGQNHINFLSLVYYIRFTNPFPESESVQREKYTTRALSLFGKTPKVLTSTYLAHAGVVLTDKHYEHSIEKIITRRCNLEFLSENDEKVDDFISIKERLPEDFNKFFEMIEAFGFSHMSAFDKCVLTPIGKAVAIANLRSKGMKKLKFRLDE